MNLAKALKQKNRLAQKINNLKEEIQRENSTRQDDPKKIKVEDLMEELNTVIDKLIKLKIVIFVAASSQRENILRLGELKSRIIFLKSIDTREGKIDGYGENEVEYTVVFDKVWIKKEVEKNEKEIDDIQEELDKFNYITEIEINS